MTRHDTPTRSFGRPLLVSEDEHRVDGRSADGGGCDWKRPRRIADLTPFTPDRLFVVPVGANAALLRHRIDGVLGTDFLSRYVMEFDGAELLRRFRLIVDYPRRQVILEAPVAAAGKDIHPGQDVRPGV